MLRAASLRAPAWWPALLLLSCALLLQGCSLLSKKSDEPAADTENAIATDGEGRKDARDAFTLEVESPDKTITAFLETHLDLQRYRRLNDLAANEVSRLMVAAEGNARELLNTLGYFTPTLTLELKDTPDSEKAPRAIHITVEPGPATRIEKVQLNFQGPVAQDPRDEAQRNEIRSGWRLPPGQIFTQQGWDAAKTVSLRTLAARRYPTARIDSSLADIDADQSTAGLQVGFASGPAYRFGPLIINGSERYDPDAARRIARLPTGQDYDQQRLLDAQLRLASSGYYDSVFLTMDTDEGTDPDAAPVTAQVREAPFQKVVLGVGFTSDSGPRISIDHIHNKMPILDWRSVSRLSLDKNTKLLSTEWTGLPADSGWRWFNLAQLQRDNNAGDYSVDSARWRTGRSRAGDHIDRSVYLQYDYSVSRGIDPPPSGSALSINWGWTGRYFDNPAAPTSGNGLAVELGAGYTLRGENLPFLRVYGRWLGLFPIGSDADPMLAARRPRLALRAEAGAVNAKEAAQIPQSLQFLTGGDTTVRGYSYRQIGVVNASGQIQAGRYMNVASVEWQQPIVRDGRLSDFEGVVFVDAGAVADEPADLGKLKVGTGVGVRWRSPVGPLQADLAYGIDVKAFRLHLRFGFTF
ncbi:autotransporter assembly complex family protein [Variovorax sp. OV329]|uniref:autotransporter assembly complex protein TamA n=1 Tax=Variovorax sp. OV329 TaxID=1882825 RepID=UPI000B83A06B|nr:BamA/TamA family outer membrane protein [Variovorax sp. OV329]